MGKSVVGTVVASVVGKKGVDFSICIGFDGRPLSFECGEGPTLQTVSNASQLPTTKPTTEATTVVTQMATTEPTTRPTTDATTDPTTDVLLIEIPDCIELPSSGSGLGRVLAAIEALHALLGDQTFERPMNVCAIATERLS